MSWLEDRWEAADRMPAPARFAVKFLIAVSPIVGLGLVILGMMMLLGRDTTPDKPGLSVPPPRLELDLDLKR